MRKKIKAVLKKKMLLGLQFTNSSKLKKLLSFKVTSYKKKEKEKRRKKKGGGGGRGCLLVEPSSQKQRRMFLKLLPVTEFGLNQEHILFLVWISDNL
jgi:hypothetical protein